jgi:hypothetical protein
MGAPGMIDVAPFKHCVCDKLGKGRALCVGALTFAEQGKKVTLGIRSGEEAKALVIDGCVLKDGKLKCDGLFLFLDNHRAAALLVELKGRDISHVFEQLAYVKHQRQEYADLIQMLGRCGRGRVVEKAFVVSNAIPSKPEKERWENKYGIRVRAILHCEATSSIPDLRDYL